MGHSIATTVMRVFPNGGATGTFDEWIYATSWGDGGIGGLHVSGTFEISSVDGGFSSHGTIVGGTCDFAGSTGTIDSTGYGLTGGYSGQWIRPRPPVAFRPFLHECIAQPSLP